MKTKKAITPDYESMVRVRKQNQFMEFKNKCKDIRWELVSTEPRTQVLRCKLTESGKCNMNICPKFSKTKS